MDRNDGPNACGVETPRTTAVPDRSDRAFDGSPSDAILAAIGDLQALPDIALRVLHIAEGDDWNVTDLADEICRDPALTARFLRVANSAHYGARRTITSPSQALTMLGSKKVRTTLLAASVEGLLQAERSNFDDRGLWRHAFATACVSEHLAIADQSCSSEDAYIAGLLHDIGRSLMDERFTERYAGVVDRVTESGTSFRSAESQVFGFDHTEAGQLVARAWGLPDQLADTIWRHHDPGAALDDRRLSATVNVANDWCVKHGLGPKTLSDLEMAERSGAQILGWNAASIDELTEGLMPMVQRLWAE